MITRIAKYAVKNIFRNTFLSISSVLVLTLLMFFINVLFVMHNISIKLIDGVNEKLTIALYLNDNYNKNDTEVIDMMNGIASVSPTVEILYKNKDDVLEDIRKKDPNLVTILEKTNPLPATIELSNINIQDYDAINREIQQRIFVLEEGNPLNNGEKTSVVGAKKGDEHFSNYTSQYDNIMQVISVLTTLQGVLYIIIAIFVFSISIIIYSIIGNFIYYYRDEIYITRLVGGSKFFIYGPFSIQGMIYSFVSFLLSLLIFVVLLKNANLLFPGEYTLNFLLGQSGLIFLLEGLVFLFIGGLSGLISSRKYLKQ